MTDDEAITILIIAYGNSLRRDDGAGLVLARRLALDWEDQGVRLIYLEVQQLAPELALEMAKPCISTVLFVDTYDARNSQSVPECLVRQLSNGSTSPSLGHHLSPIALCIYAHNLYNKKPLAWLITVPGWDFEHSEGLSVKARAAVEDAFQEIYNLGVDFWMTQ